MPPAQANLARTWWITLALLAFFFWMQSFVLGLDPYDNTTYLWATTLVAYREPFRVHAWSPLYIYYLEAVGRICHDMVARYFVAWGITAAALALVPVSFRMRRSWIYGAVLISFPFLTTDPFLSLFVAPFLVAGLCLVLRRRLPLQQMFLLFAATAFVLSFARPEYDYAVFLCAIASLASLLLQAIHPTATAFLSARPLPRAAMLTALTVLIACGTVAVLHHADRSRSGIAFAQHFNMRAAEHGGLHTTAAWKEDYALRVFHLDPGHDATNTTTSIGDFFRANPHLFLRHIARNLIDKRTLEILLPSLVLLAWPWFFGAAAHMRHASFYLLVAALPSVAAMIVIYPRPHYAILVFPMLLLYATQLPDGNGWLTPPLWVLPVGCLLIWYTNVGSRLRHETLEPPAIRMNLERIQCTRAFDRSTPARRPVFDATGIKFIYLFHDHDAQTLATLPTWQQFQTWATTSQPEWISTDPGVAKAYGIAPDDFDDFVRGKLRFTPHVCAAAPELTIYTNDAP